MNDFKGNYLSSHERKTIKIPLSDAAAGILRIAHDRVPDDALYIVKGSLVRLGKSDANGFINKEKAAKEIAQILGAIAYALKGDFDREKGLSYRDKYPFANTHLSKAFIDMINS